MIVAFQRATPNSPLSPAPDTAYFSARGDGRIPHAYGPVVIVHAHLTTRTFEAGGKEYTFHDGMVGKAEVRTDESSLLRALLPGKGE